MPTKFTALPLRTRVVTACLCRPVQMQPVGGGARAPRLSTGTMALQATFPVKRAASGPNIWFRMAE